MLKKIIFSYLSFTFLILFFSGCPSTSSDSKDDPTVFNLKGTSWGCSWNMYQETGRNILYNINLSFVDSSNYVDQWTVASTGEDAGTYKGTYTFDTNTKKGKLGNQYDFNISSDNKKLTYENHNRLTTMNLLSAPSSSGIKPNYFTTVGKSSWASLTSKPSNMDYQVWSHIANANTLYSRYKSSKKDSDYDNHKVAAQMAIDVYNALN